ncbi:30S ribosomal protein S8 [Candidatus Roizmanbacteria bacterium CG_4_8_14_3_um_filter_34_9]|uniref:Small ribosomal subunit protein uS8 n=3 Tax=Candidatus Roizmaniibacteriota TaxID=1752723 RepID=A0A2M7AV27_9BACT|nr:MAG: 30S ribosomal protein S8 [Candidatus Roizmanbacteria bacterium CG07_land_8_20_14_0_80_34_15]PIU74495.1 MAG: 30S ribosomal protein S8 [Candidatus Roizmanbacteria bacterium CG06_land_8_20_14_3_00_34_14]PIW73191.1 MAG: 30S ribosomal protein S8 [Candidatus Roizmanbacteria bacterium CG_4_8_14_3_um_filter_34_9]
MENSIIDLVIRIKNGYMAKKPVILSPHSKYKEAVLEKLKKLKFIEEYKVEGDIKKNITINLKYEEGVPAITDIKVFSKPGMRLYVSYKNLKPVLSGFGYSVLSTSKGIMTDREAKKAKMGGELLFSFW